jgi:cytosine/uracil/thiamine/allantoin permease
MSKSNATENDVLKANLKGTDPAWRGNANRYIALYTADPGEAGTATTNETAYTNYARVAVSVADWTDGGSTFSNTNLIQFPECGVTGATLTHVAIVTTASGAGQILYSGELNSPLAVANLIQPQFAAGNLTVSED